MTNNVKRMSIVVDQTLYEEIVNIATLENRSLNYTVILLLMKAIKEKTRKRGKKESNIQHNTPN
jgi:hypothetical protein